MIRRFKEFLCSLLLRFWPARNRQLMIRARPIQDPQPHATAGNLRRISRAEQRRNPAMEALREVFAPRHAAEEQVVFTSIRCDGVVVEKSEEWFREGNSMKTVSKRNAVVTCSGEIVSPADIKAKCATCGGFDSHVARCSHPQCGVALCQLHLRTFLNGSTAVVLCERHFQDALRSFDTWAALDRARIQSRHFS